MKTLRLIALSCAAASFAFQAAALFVDDSSMNKPSDASRFSDPDEQSPVQLGGSANLQGTASGNTDPSSVRYDYDAASGSFTPHKE